MRVEIKSDTKLDFEVRSTHLDRRDIVITGVDSSGDRFYLYLTPAQHEPLLLALDLLTSSSHEGDDE